MITQVLKKSRKFFSQQQTNIFSAAFTIALAMLGSAILGILRDRFLYARFYAQNPGQLDAYNAAFKLPDVLFQLLITGSLSAAFIPVLSQLLDHNPKKANQVTSTVFNWLIVMFLFLAVIIFIFAQPFSKIITADIGEEQVSLIASLTRLLLIAQFFLLISNLLTGIIHAHQRFILPALSPIVYNLGIIAGIIFLSDHFGIYGPTLGVILGSFLHFAIQIPLIYKLKFSFKPFLFNVFDRDIKKIIRLLIPRNLSLIVSELEEIIIIYWATFMGKGMLSLFYLAQHLSQLPIRLLGSAVGQAILPAFAHEQNKNGSRALKNLITKVLLQTTYLVLPICSLFLVLRIPLVRLAFGAKEFPWEATLLTGKTLAILTMAIFCQTINEILRRSFYALSDTKTALRVDSSATFFNLAFMSILVLKSNWGILVLATGISLSNFIRLFLFLLMLKKKIGLDINRKIIFSITEMGIFAIAASLSTWGGMRVLDKFIFNTSRVIPLIGLTATATLIGIGTYVFLSYLFKINEFYQFLNLTKRALSKSAKI
ncbi:hypothetical protein COT63_00680 [Candidatus Shapirobacteria bacterium CG09_land_8_20_14_0_10_38_17]|uniref:Lipid II flippase MurJ n=1 Tax=Candidatus Shapirobacteria bacterium CG09_land_8_20_14_0_10_38_17 TaxID=1974884 RepID=A0A2H0WTR1_9BACT|nr:MAG: hypothetical protein COT63_00680 [Candidatus Shapirobacteria bacterium CG09_land_8_20_14_0_10_38_17]